MKNGFLNVSLPEEKVNELLRRTAEINNYELTVDLQNCEVCDQRGFRCRFSIDEFVRHCLLKGLDEIGLTLQHESAISAYETKHASSRSVTALQFR